MLANPVLDDIDHQLLALMQADATRPLHVLGDLVSLSPSAVQRRLTRLRKTGVIQAEVALVDPKALGLGLTTVVLVELVEDNPEDHATFCEQVRAEPAVRECYSVVGQWDYVVVLVTTDLAAYREVSQRLFVSEAEVRRYETMPTYEKIKASPSPPADEAASRA